MIINVWDIEGSSYVFSLILLLSWLMFREEVLALCIQVRVLAVKKKHTQKNSRVEWDGQDQDHLLRRIQIQTTLFIPEGQLRCN